MSNPSAEPRVAWAEEFGKTKIEVVCHENGEIYLSFDWNGTMVWEWIGVAGDKRFPKWLRKVADRMEKKL
jgi:hypothetical protein